MSGGEAKLIGIALVVSNRTLIVAGSGSSIVAGIAGTSRIAATARGAGAETPQRIAP